MGKSFLKRLKTAPIPYDKTRAEDGASHFAGSPEPFLNLIAGVAGCSPFLTMALQKEHEWIGGLLKEAPETLLEECLAPFAIESQTDLMRILRIRKRRIALLTALADCGGAWSLDDVTKALTDFADFAVHETIRFLVAAEIARGKLPAQHEDVAKGAGLVAIAMGKTGAYELNYSSDIDLIMLFNQEAYDPSDYGEARAAFIRVVQKMVKILQDRTEDGYVFRVDLRLRPDPSVTPVVMAMEPAERYYESYGRNWERAAFIKARASAGDIEAGQAFLERLQPFVYRKHLDFAAIQDAHDMRLRIRDHRGLSGAIKLPGHNMKLGRGGIREIEFFAQTRQIIAGGRDRELRDIRTVDALASLAKKGWIEPKIQTLLTERYEEWRRIEHRLQMIDDAQTHLMPETRDKIEQVANFCGYDSVDIFIKKVEADLAEVDGIIESFFNHDAGRCSSEISIADFGEDAQKVISAWYRLPMMRSQRAREIYRELEPLIFEKVLETSQPNATIMRLDEFFRHLPAGVQIFSLFKMNPNILDLLVDICATSKELAGHLGQHTNVLDAVLTQDFFKPVDELEVMKTKLNARLQEAEDYETCLNLTRRWQKDQHFRASIHLMRKIATPDETAYNFSNIAETCLQCLYPKTVKDFARRYGPPPGKGAAIIAMGKLGSGEMTALSDLDLIILYEPDGEEQSNGPKSLPVRTYYQRLTQAIINSFSAQTGEGKLYEIDMRLRPSGRQGPVATTISGFHDYHRTQAWTWEHLALTRARVLAGDAEVIAATEAEIQSVLMLERDPENIVKDVEDMRNRLLESKAGDEWSLKDGPGKMLDIELLLQLGVLLNGGEASKSPMKIIPSLVDEGWLRKGEARVLFESLGLLRELQQFMRLSMDQGLRLPEASPNLIKLMLESAGVESLEKLEDKLKHLSLASAEVISVVLERVGRNG